MRKSTRMLSALSLTLALAGLGFTAPATLAQTPAQTQSRDMTYGSQLMTQKERIEFRNAMRNAKTDQERDQLRLEHHKAMQERAKAQGLTLPDTPPAIGAGRGPGGGGMGPGGGGMGPGAGRNR